MAFAVLSRTLSKTKGPVRPVAKGRAARKQYTADSKFGFTGPVFQRPAAVLPTPPVIQTKLKVGASDDKFEQEADRVAGKVMRLPHGARPAFDSYSELSESPGMATAAVQRRCTACAEEEDLRRIIRPNQNAYKCTRCTEGRSRTAFQ